MLSEKVIRALVGTGQFTSDENAILLAEYLAAHGHAGRWRKGSRLSLAYLTFFMAWGIFAVAWPLIAGLGEAGELQFLGSFTAIHVVTLLGMFILWRRGFIGLLLEMREKGCEIAWKGQSLPPWEKRMTAKP